MIKRPITVSQLLQLLPTEKLAAIANDTAVDYQVKKLTGEVMFRLLLMSMLNSERVSLRIMEQMYASNRFKLIAGIEEEDNIRFTSISARMATINADYFKQIFETTYELLSKHYDEKHLEKYHIKRYDSTFISASARMLKSGMVNGRPDKNGERTLRQIKISLGFDGVLASSAQLFTQRKYINDDPALREIILKSSHPQDSIVVFDRGLKKRSTFVEFDNLNIHFVTRTNPTHNYDVIKDHAKVKGQQTETLKLVSDQWVNFYNKQARKVKHPFRLIRAKSIVKSNEELLFVTNIGNLDAANITELYRHRWDIEVFFRFLKQELNLKHFLSYSENGIQVMMYMTLIAAMLLMIYKKINGLSGYKIPKFMFEEELDLLITREIVILCGGDPNKLKILDSS